MIVGKKVLINAACLQDALEEAHAIIDQNWLASEQQQDPHDPILINSKKIGTLQDTIRVVEQNGSAGMHPIAEALVVAKQLLTDYERTKRLGYSPFVYLLLSLRDVGKALGQIPGARSRVGRLFGSEWKSALYELLTAAAYSEVAPLEFLPEGTSPTPDMKLFLDPPTYVECKAKLQYVEPLSEFRSSWCKYALGEITRLLDTVSEGVMAKVILSDPSQIPDVPFLFNLAVANHLESVREKEVRLELHWMGREEWKPPYGSMADPEHLWDLMFNFRDWTSWHHILSGFSLKLRDNDKRVIEAVRRPKLVCTKASWLPDTRQNIITSLKSACKEQLKAHRPGVLHTLIQSQLYELGEGIPISVLLAELETISAEIFRQYTRIGRLAYDVVIPPNAKKYSASMARVVSQNSRCANFPSNYTDPQPVLLL